MTGLRRRLEAVEGVESIKLEVGDEGLQGISVRLAEGADEVSVLEGIRRLLVAYGRRSVTEPEATSSVTSVFDDGAEPQPEIGDEPVHEVIDLDELGTAVLPSPDDSGDPGPTSARLITTRGSVVELSILPVGDGSAAVVNLEWDGEAGRRQVPASARAVVQAVIDVGAELIGRDPISVIGMNLSSIGGTRVLTVIAGNHATAPRVCTASVVGLDWPSALLGILTQVLDAVPVDISDR